MQYTVRTFVEGRDARLDEICRVFCSMERTTYNMLREDLDAGRIKHSLRERYGMRNARWVQSAINQGKAVMESQEKEIEYMIAQYQQKVRNTREKAKHLSNPLKIEGCKAKILKFESRTDGLREQLLEKSYPRAVFGSRRLFHQMSVAGGPRRDELRKEWREKRSNHFFSVGQANQRGNGNTGCFTMKRRLPPLR